MLLVAYLASITKGLNTVNDLVDKFNLVNGGNGASQNKPVSVGRKGRVRNLYDEISKSIFNLILFFSFLAYEYNECWKTIKKNYTNYLLILCLFGYCKKLKEKRVRGRGMN